MNQFMHMDITNQAMITRNFINSLTMAAMKNDGAIDKDERKAIDNITKEAEKFIKLLEKEAKKFE